MSTSSLFFGHDCVVANVNDAVLFAMLIRKALILIIKCQVHQHNYNTAVFIPQNFPEAFDCVNRKSLGANKLSLIFEAINVIRMDVIRDSKIVRH